MPSVMVDAQPSLKLVESLVESSECSPVEQEQPQGNLTTTDTVARDEAGRILPGQVSLNPAGRTPGTKNRLISHKQKIDLAVREAVSAERLKRIIIKMCEMAEKGDRAAARLILDKFVSSAGADGDTAEEKSQGITIRIENATFAKTQPPVDATFTEIT